MKNFSKVLILTSLIFTLTGSRLVKEDEVQRPLEVWAIRSVLDKKPRMLTVALDKEMYIAYDMTRCKIYKVWKGGISMDGTAYTGKKEIQPTSWGANYLSDSSQNFNWTAKLDGKELPIRMQSKGYVFRKNQIYLQHDLLLGIDTIRIEERPEFVRNNAGKPGLERVFVTSNVPANVSVTLKSTLGNLEFVPNGRSRHVDYFDALPAQSLPVVRKEYAHQGQEIIEKSDCLTCHELYEANVGPSFQQVAMRYPKDVKTLAQLSSKIKYGGTGAWGSGVMNAHPTLSADELNTILDYVFTLKPKDAKPRKSTEEGVVNSAASLPVKPGFGASLAGVHPAYELTDLHTSGFKPKVGAMAFLPDGRLLVTTWDAVGGLYVLDGVTGENPTEVKVKRIASGLAEPLGMAVVDGEIYVLQKQELTKLIDHDGDEVIDEYRTICNSWEATADFHEFSFGLVYRDGYFYATLSMAMRLTPEEKQLPDRGRTIRISKDGSFESVNFGLRTPNGIGVGVDDELFVLDNQGQWLPGNKLIHVREGDFNGMGWGWLDESAPMPRMVPPAIWLPEDEIGNSPSEPVLITEGTYKGQMLHGEVTHGGIVRDFLEKVNGKYQGAAFRFSQGFAAGINRMRWGPDGALYVGEVGMAPGGWSWKDQTSGLQKLTYTGKVPFEMLAVRAKPKGFEIEFTEPLSKNVQADFKNLFIQQWWYKPTPSYGGPKMDLTDLKASRMSLSQDGRRLYVEIPGLRKENVIYFRLPIDLKSASGHPLWTSEAWYTLNEIPK
ncbi:c-type cytochrome [Persicitalea jodogahamensis]|uniref:c-type cytochrome n=1 Tax=Persicitalea jodogahamensis TaxID=402147 RepID=UPI001676B0DC|nr:c-type cytochrome [Persicitalea jodogahamensis]